MDRKSCQSFANVSVKSATPCPTPLSMRKKFREGANHTLIAVCPPPRAFATSNVTRAGTTRAVLAATERRLRVTTLPV